MLLLAARWIPGGFAFWSYERSGDLPPGFASANGRIEVERVDIASKLVGRVEEIRVKEGDFVEKDTIIAQLDTSELQAQLDAAKASVQRAVASIDRAKAEIAIREAKPWCMMSAYNKINGTFASAHGKIQNEIVKGEWGFDGIIMSD